jgi:hypothetical protein
MDKNAGEIGTVAVFHVLYRPKINMLFQHISTRIVSVLRSKERWPAALA